MLANSEVAGGILMLLVMMLAYTSPVWMLLIAWLVGRGIEQSHLRDLQRREYDVGRRIIVMGHEDLPPGVTATQGQMVMGTVVVGVDHFKRFLAGWRKLVGGEVRSISPVLTRARREAVLRMLEQADAQGANSWSTSGWKRRSSAPAALSARSSAWPKSWHTALR